MTKEQAFKDINETQKFYVDELVKALYDKNREIFKELNFTSDTGTGKTNMMALLLNKMPEKYFIITTLSKGQLNAQIKKNLSKLTNQDNFVVYGLNEFTANTRLQAQDILAKLPPNKDIVWLRDEGHIHTNKWQEVVNSKCWKIINISATNKEEGIRCNFAHTMMLSTVIQREGTPEDALDKLLEIKKQHRHVVGYNPCAIMRCLDKHTTEITIEACKKRKLKYIDITEETFDMSNLCQDDNDYDVIINKFKIVEGIDLRRAHVIYMTNNPSNISTTIQIIGRARRNALLYRNDIDIFAPENKKLLDNTRQCFVFYNIQGMQVDSDQFGNLCSAFCDKISCEKLKVGSHIVVNNGIMDNGLSVIELQGETGEYTIEKDETTGFNIIKPQGKFYQSEKKTQEPTLYGFTKNDLLSMLTTEKQFNYAFNSCEEVKVCTVPIEINKSRTLSWDSIKSMNLPFNDYECECYKTNYRYAVKLTYYTNDRPIVGRINKDGTIFIAKREISHETKYFCTEKGRDDFIKSLPPAQDIFPEKIYVHSTYLMGYSSRRPRECTIYWGEGELQCITPTNTQTVQLKSISKYKKIQEKDIINYFDNVCYSPYSKIVNDRESAIIGTDLMKPIKNENGETVWIEDKSVTSKVNKYSKLNTFIQKRYASQIKHAELLLYNGHNNFNFSTKCNACLGYCVEYYGKYLVFGENFLKKYILDAQKESKTDILNDNIIVRSCMLMYRDIMIQTYGSYMGKLIKTISIGELIQKKYKDFVETVVRLGHNVANFIQEEFKNGELFDIHNKRYDANLSIEHISGLADFVAKNKIIDIKCTNSITIAHIKQVLSYHYLSTKRDDLDIKEVVVFDAVSKKCIRCEV